MEKTTTVKRKQLNTEIPGNPIMREVFAFVQLLLKHEKSQWLERRNGFESERQWVG